MAADWRHGRWPWVPPGRARGILGAAAVAAITFGGTFGAQRHQYGGRALDPLGLALLAVICAAMLLRRRNPAATLLIVAAGVCVYFTVGYPWGPVFLPLVIALVTAVMTGHRVLAWVVSAVVYSFVIWGSYYLGGVGRRPGLSIALGVAAWHLLILIGAEVLRSGRERAASAARGRAELSRRRASEERLRIAQELHDVLAHNISLISVQAGVALHFMDEQPAQAAEQARTALTAIRQASKEALGELRSVLGLLRGAEGEHPPLSPVPGLAQLNDLTSRATAAGIAVRTQITGAERPLPADVDLAAYRIVQEALTNVIRHSGAANVVVRVDYGDASLRIEIEDDGRGAASQPTGRADRGGNGIPGMRERARLLGGELTAGPLPGRGFQVTARLPIVRRPGGSGPGETGQPGTAPRNDQDQVTAARAPGGPP